MQSTVCFINGAKHHKRLFEQQAVKIRLRYHPSKTAPLFVMNYPKNLSAETSLRVLRSS